MEEYLAKMYALPFPGDPESLKALIARDTARWGTLVKAAGIERNDVAWMVGSLREPTPHRPL